MKLSFTTFLKTITSVTLMSGITLSLAACNHSPVTTSANQKNLTSDIHAETITGQTADNRFITSTAGFSMELFRQSVQNGPAGENTLISPESVLSALAMTANGAGSSTRSDMESVLCNGMAMEEFIPICIPTSIN